MDWFHAVYGDCRRITLIFIRYIGLIGLYVDPCFSVFGYYCLLQIDMKFKMVCVYCRN